MSREKTSICDALLAGEPGVITFEINRKNLAGGIAVSDSRYRFKRTVRLPAPLVNLSLENCTASSR